jgi:protoheme ferro-lyase
VQFLPWAVTLIAGLAAGAALCAALVVPRRWITPALVFAVIAVTAAGVACSAIWAAAERLDLVIAAVALSVGTGAGGYALGAATLDVSTRHRRRPVQLVIAAATAGEHVVLLSDEEPETYDPGAVAEGLARYVGSDIDLPPDTARPLIYASERSRYNLTGGSPARATVRAVAASLEERLRADGHDAEVAVAFCVGTPSLAETTAEIVGRGGRTIVVAPLSAAWSQAFTEALDSLPRPALAAAGVSIETSAPVWASPHVSVMIAQRVVALLGGDRSSDGVVLFSEGDPWEHTVSCAEYREQLTFLIQRVRAELIHAGVAADRIRRAWLWLEAPDVAEAVRHLTAIGARNVVLVPVTFPTETMTTLTDVRYSADRAAADTGATVSVVSPWGNDPAVVEALFESVTEVLDRPDA